MYNYSVKVELYKITAFYGKFERGVVMTLKKSGCFLRKTVAVLAAAVTAAVSASALKVSVSAAAYNGKGTKNSPYLVETFEQLQGISSKLSAHYKLNNTIDCSGQTLKPIGNLSAPFTGSFVCDADSDGTPKYAIKNLKVQTAYGNYVKDKSGWESALFGCTSGATLTNIAVIDANITSEVVGLNQMNADWSRNPGQDEQATAVLIGIAKKTAVKGCMSSGTVNSKSNHCGGLIGRATGSTISDSYSTATVTSTGLWCHGGLIGSTENGKISNCFASGDVKSLASGVAGLLGSVSKDDITNCYSTGTVGNGATPPEYGSLYGYGSSRPSPSSVKNSYSISKVAGLASAPASASNSDNCYILNTAGCAQKGFSPASQAEINSKFASVDGWTVSGNTPTLKSVAVILNTSKYVPQAVTNPPANNNTANSVSDTQTDDTDADTADTSGSNSSMTAEEFAKEIDSLMEKLVTDNKLSEKQAFKVLELKKELENMSAEETAKVETSAKKSLNTLYEAAANKLIVVMTGELEKLPDPKKVDASNAASVIETYKKYEKLTDEIKESLSEEGVAKLKKCYEAAKKYDGVSVINQEKSLGAAEWVLIARLALLNLAALAAVVYMIILNVKVAKKSGALKSENKEKT